MIPFMKRTFWYFIVLLAISPLFLWFSERPYTHSVWIDWIARSLLTALLFAFFFPYVKKKPLPTDKA